MFGNGSDGDLILNSGSRSLSLNRKYQYKKIHIAAGATLTTNSTTGAVLYLVAQDEIRIDGTVDLSNKVNHGDNTWAVTIDGVEYKSPGVANGGYGSYFTDQAVTEQGAGFGGGGSGGLSVSAPKTSGQGGTGGANGGSGGAGRDAHTGVTANKEVFVAGYNGGVSAGGGGGATAIMRRTSGTTATGISHGYTGGKGGNSYGANGSNAPNPAGAYSRTASGGNLQYDYYSYGGGGAGGRAGRAGVHIVLKAPRVIVNGMIITAATDGQKGGDGGRSANYNGWTDYYGLGGGGGGGGRAGYFEVISSTPLSYTGGWNGNGGYGGYGGYGASEKKSQAGNGWGGQGGRYVYTALAPDARFTSPRTAYRSGSIQFTNQTVGASSYLWDFGDGNTSTLENPTHTYTENGTFTIKLTATNATGSTIATKEEWVAVSTIVYERSTASKTIGKSRATPTKESASLDITSVSYGRGNATYFTTYQAIARKEYEYRIYDENWNYISTWVDVESDFGYTQRLGENASELMIRLSRNPENRVSRYDNLHDTNGDLVLDTNGDVISVHTSSPNSVGPGTDVRENLNVEVYAFYGGYEALLDETGDPILDTNSEIILVRYGAPNGARVYSGYIAEYDLSHGGKVGTEVVVVPHSTELAHYVFLDGNKTTVKYLNVDPVQMARDAMDSYIAQGGHVKWNESSMPLSGQSTDYEFKLQSTRESLEKAVNLLPSGFSFFPHPGENLVYMREKPVNPIHVFYYGKHISEFRLRKSILGLVNDVYFSGGEFDPVNYPGVDMLQHYRDTYSSNSIRRGLLRLSDSRVTLDSTAETLSRSQIEANKVARYRSTISITDAVYDIESIKLGDTVAGKNFGTFVDEIVLEVVGITRSKHKVVLDLDTALTTTAKRLETLKRQIEQEQIRNIPVEPMETIDV